MTRSDECARYWNLGQECPIHLSSFDWAIGLSFWIGLLALILFLLSRSLKARPVPHHRTEAYVAEFRRMREVVLRRDHYRCVSCGSTRRLNVHHIKARVVGGSNDPSNLITLCRRHHGQAHGQHWQ